MVTQTYFFLTRKRLESDDRLEMCFDLGYLAVSFIPVNH
jgi:hypothetical protein